MTTPRVFVSYSHDSPSHKQWVLDLATRLRISGVDAILDLWELQPGDDLPMFMERNLASASRVLMVCTENYVDKANSGTGGVGYEKMIVTADLAQSIDSRKVIPIIRQNGTRRVPTFLATKLFIDFSREGQFEFSFDELVRTIHEAPLFVKPPVGTRPTFADPPPPSQTGDPILVLMKIIVTLFEGDPSTEYIPYKHIASLAKQQGVSRLYLDNLLAELINSDLIRRIDDFISISPRGRKYAMDNKLA